MIADILGDRIGCFLFQLPPGNHYTKTRLNDIVIQLDPARRNVVELRHGSWWNEEVYSAFRKAGIIYCSCSGPRLPDELIRPADEVYVRLHGSKRWYRHDYSKEELMEWTNRIRASGAKRYNDAHAPKNAAVLRRMLKGFGSRSTETVCRNPQQSPARGNILKASESHPTIDEQRQPRKDKSAANSQLALAKQRCRQNRFLTTREATEHVRVAEQSGRRMPPHLPRSAGWNDGRATTFFAIITKETLDGHFHQGHKIDG